MTRPRVRILDGRFDPLTTAETVDSVFALLASGTRGWLCTVNVSTLMTMRRDAALRSFVERARLVVADGQPLVWCAKLFGARLPERVAGIDLIESLCVRAASDGHGIYLLGATPALVDATRVALLERHPGLRIDCADGYFTTAQAQTRADAIRASGASLLFVGMGAPRQEAFIDAHWERLGVGVAIGIGGSFDVLGGARFRAPRWVRSAGLEWLVRLVQEPVRLLPRYVSTNTMFCVLVARTVVGRLRQRLSTS